MGALGVLYLLVTAALVARGAGERGVVSWGGGPLVLAPGVAAVVAGRRMLYDTVVLRAPGIAVEGRLESSYDVGTGEDAVTPTCTPTSTPVAGGGSAAARRAARAWSRSCTTPRIRKAPPRWGGRRWGS
ncbi:hypothetical protein ACWDG1_05290 [Streptomyces sp. NPDC001177]